MHNRYRDLAHWPPSTLNRRRTGLHKTVLDCHASLTVLRWKRTRLPCTIRRHKLPFVCRGHEN